MVCETFMGLYAYLPQNLYPFRTVSCLLSSEQEYFSVTPGSGTVEFSHSQKVNKKPFFWINLAYNIWPLLTFAQHLAVSTMEFWKRQNRHTRDAQRVLWWGNFPSPQPVNHICARGEIWWVNMWGTNLISHSKKWGISEDFVAKCGKNSFEILFFFPVVFTSEE